MKDDAGEFVEWSGPGKYNGIYYHPKSKVYTSVLSDLEGLKFNELEEIREWLNVGRFKSED
jgi:hypothetical protein